MGETLGGRLKHLLELRGITQREFAKKTDLTEVTVSRYINGERLPKADAIVLLCQTLGTSSDWLLGLNEDESDQQNQIHMYATSQKDNMYNLISQFLEYNSVSDLLLLVADAVERRGEE